MTSGLRLTAYNPPQINCSAPRPAIINPYNRREGQPGQMHDNDSSFLGDGGSKKHPSNRALTDAISNSLASL